MHSTSLDRTDPSDGKSDASPSGPGYTPKDNLSMPRELHIEIERRAYELAQRRGFDPGHELEDWLEAERQVVFGMPRNTPPDKPRDQVKTYSNE